eukprot:352610-Chlamydomonas_euryale.AAC.10
MCSCACTTCEHACARCRARLAATCNGLTRACATREHACVCCRAHLAATCNGLTRACATRVNMHVCAAVRTSRHMQQTRPFVCTMAASAHGRSAWPHACGHASHAIG